MKVQRVYGSLSQINEIVSPKKSQFCFINCKIFTTCPHDATRFTTQQLTTNKVYQPMFPKVLRNFEIVACNEKNKVHFTLLSVHS